MKNKQVKESVAKAGKMLLAEGLVARTWGNISGKVDQESFAITPSGLGYEDMSADDIVIYNSKEKTWEGTRKPSSEKGIHQAAYETFEDVEFVIHTHQNYASAIGLAGFNKLVLTGEENAKLGGIALASYGLPGTKTLMKNVKKAFETGAHTVFMEHHGVVIGAVTLEDAFDRARLLEEVCQKNYLGIIKEHKINEAEAQRLVELAKARFGHSMSLTTNEILTVAECGKKCYAQLDDMAQMIGRELVVVKDEDMAVINALEEYDAVIVKGVGAIARGTTESDCSALCMLVEKSALSFLHTQSLDKDARINWLHTKLMRTVYLKKYSKKIGE